MSEIQEWEAGTPCQRHDLAWCADCRATAHLHRDSAGVLRYQADCAVQTFAEVTGASYDDAVTALRAAGFHPGSGTPAVEGVNSALRTAGYTLSEVTRVLTPDQAAASGRVFVVSAQKGKRGHAWSIANGRALRAYSPPYRYRIFEVTRRGE